MIHSGQSWVFLVVAKPHLSPVGPLFLGPGPVGNQEDVYSRVTHYPWVGSWFLPGHLCPGTESNAQDKNNVHDSHTMNGRDENSCLSHQCLKSTSQNPG